MPSRTRSVAILSANSAFASILAGALGDDPGFRVPCFGALDALTTYLRIAPVDVVVLDDADDAERIATAAQALRTHPKLANPDFSILVLTRSLERHDTFVMAGADAVLQKPVTPLRLGEAIDGLINPPRQPAWRASGFRHSATQAGAERVGNVIPLFGEGRAERLAR